MLIYRIPPRITPRSLSGEAKIATNIEHCTLPILPIEYDVLLQTPLLLNHRHLKLLQQYRYSITWTNNERKNKLDFTKIKPFVF